MKIGIDKYSLSREILTYDGDSTIIILFILITTFMVNTNRVAKIVGKGAEGATCSGP